MSSWGCGWLCFLTWKGEVATHKEEVCLPALARTAVPHGTSVGFPGVWCRCSGKVRVLRCVVQILSRECQGYRQVCSAGTHVSLSGSRVWPVEAR